jgi:hypothetical protein
LNDLVAILSNLKEDPAAKRHNLSFIAKTDDFNETFSKMWSDLHGSNPKPKIGMLLSDTKTGQIAEEFLRFL